MVNPRGPAPAPGPLDALLSVATGAVAMVASTVDRVVTTVVTTTLDRVVPMTVTAILDRMDLTGMVIDRVDLTRVVQRTLDQMDLTELVLERVDIDRLVDKADLEAILNRLPLIDLAQYIIDEIDLPKIIRESTGGIATDAMNSVRIQAIDVDQLLARFTDAALRRKKGRHTDAPGNPQSMGEQP